jgi:2-keto-3-deoxy-L-rhamnonate aldolase RhmA
LDAIEQIAQVPRLDSVVLGPYDLSGAIDRLGRVDGPALNDAINRVVAAARAAGVHVGMGMPVDPVFASTMIARGVNWIQLGSDFEYMIQHVEQTGGQLRRRT